MNTPIQFAVLQRFNKHGRRVYVRPFAQLEDLLEVAQKGDTLHKVAQQFVQYSGANAATPLIEELSRQLNEGEFTEI